jgi:hypothetical protein
MTELERALTSLDVDWPVTPAFDLRRPARRRAWAVALAAALLALGVAFAVPQSRAALLRVLHVGGVTVERVQTLPAAQERPLASTLGMRVSAAEAEALLGRPFGVQARLYRSGDVVSALLRGPVVLSELRTGVGTMILKKLVGTGTTVRYVRADGAPGVWITGAPHVVLAPELPPRLEGNVLVWVRGAITYRLEGKALTLDAAQDLAGLVRDR